MPIPSLSPKGGVVTVTAHEKGKLLWKETYTNKIVYVARELTSGIIADRTRKICFLDGFVPMYNFGGDVNCQVPPGTDKWFFPKYMCWSENVPSGVVPTALNRDLDGDIINNSLGNNRWTAFSRYDYPDQYSVSFEATIGGTASGADFLVTTPVTIDEEGIFGRSPNNTGLIIADYFLYAAIKEPTGAGWSLPLVGSILTFEHKIQF